MKKILGIDIGGTKISGIVWDGKGIIVHKKISTPQNIQEFQASLGDLVSHFGGKNDIKGIGIACAGVIDPAKGTVVNSPNLQFLNGFNFKTFFQKNSVTRNVKVDNDVNCFTRAEMVLGKGSEFKNFIGMTLGTGIGGGLVINGKIYRGAHYSGAEIGYIILDNGQFFEKIYQEFRNQGDVEKVGEVLGFALASLYNVLDPEAIILGGTVTKEWHSRFFPTMIKSIQVRILNPKLKPKILISKLRHAGAMGAALLFK